MGEKRVSLSADMRAYSFSPAARGIGAKLPMHPLRRVVRGGPGLTVFQVTKSGLQRSIRHQHLSIHPLMHPQAGWMDGQGVAHYSSSLSSPS
jgi:hypothetical protein